jgi:DMSO/TMAO reductase YedYZ molybdopterin-dependent catalytic subunit
MEARAPASGPTAMRARARATWAAATGVIAAIAALGAAEIVALFVAPGSSPLFAVGSFVIDIVPPWFKDLAIALFGTADKIALFVGLGLLVLVLAALVGLLEARRVPWGSVLLVAVGIVAGATAVTRAEANLAWALPTAIGVFVGVLVLRSARLRLEPWADGEIPPLFERRDFLRYSGVTVAVGAIAAVGGRMINAGTTVVETVRQAIALPKPTTVSAPIPAGAELDIPGISELVTANDVFYRIDTALQVPVLDATAWRLRVVGMVEREIEIGYEELLAKPLTESTVTLMCVSNEVGGGLVGNATWLGWPIRELLEQAGPLAGADMVLSRSSDGFTAGTPLEVLLERDRDSLLAVGMNGEALPLDHGFPVRMVVPGLYGYVSATKWVVELKVTTFARDQGYWTPRGWDALGPVKTASRIDVPRSGDPLRAGRVAVAGVAWAQHRGIHGVEVRIDEGAWRPARLAEAISSDTWVQWVYEWDATPGAHLIAVRATDADGDTQSGNRVPPAPNGSEGWHTITVNVA